VEELFSYMLTKARDQDVVQFCYSLESNPLARPLLVQFFKDNYDAVSNCNIPCGLLIDKT
jgi:hypothetical protein